MGHHDDDGIDLDGPRNIDILHGVVNGSPNYNYFIIEDPPEF